MLHALFLLALRSGGDAEFARALADAGYLSLAEETATHLTGPDAGGLHAEVLRHAGPPAALDGAIQALWKGRREEAMTIFAEVVRHPLAAGRVRRCALAGLAGALYVEGRERVDRADGDPAARRDGVKFLADALQALRRHVEWVLAEGNSATARERREAANSLNLATYLLASHIGYPELLRPDLVVDLTAEVSPSLLASADRYPEVRRWMICVLRRRAVALLDLFESADPTRSAIDVVSTIEDLWRLVLSSDSGGRDLEIACSRAVETLRLVAATLSDRKPADRALLLRAADDLGWIRRVNLASQGEPSEARICPLRR